LRILTGVKKVERREDSCGKIFFALTKPKIKLIGKTGI